MFRWPSDRRIAEESNPYTAPTSSLFSPNPDQIRCTAASLFLYCAPPRTASVPNCASLTALPRLSRKKTACAKLSAVHADRRALELDLSSWRVTPHCPWRRADDVRKEEMHRVQRGARFACVLNSLAWQGPARCAGPGIALRRRPLTACR